MRFKKPYTIFIFLLISIQYLMGQDLSYEQYTERDGLPSMQTYEMVQDSNGILWIGTENGLVSYDGVLFKRYSHPQLVNYDIIEIALDRDGRVFFLNLSNQIAYVESDLVLIVDTKSIDNRISNIITTKEKNFLLLNDTKRNSNGILEFSELNTGEFSFENTELMRFQMKNNRISEHFYDVKNKILEIDSQKIKFNKPYHNNIFKTFDDRHFHMGREGFFLEVDSFLYKILNQKKFERIKRYGNNFFVFYDKGIMIYDNETQEQLNLFNDITINTVFKDKEGSLWFSARKDGLFRIPNTSFQDKSKHIALIRDKGISDIIQDENGTKYVGTTNGEIIIYSKEKKFLRKVKISRNSRPVFFFKSNNIILGYSDLNICSIDTKTKNIVGLKDYYKNIKSLVSYNDIFYVGTRYGIVNLYPEEYQYPIGQKGKYLKGSWINSLHLSEQNQILYIGTFTGIYKLNLNDDLNPTRLENIKDYVISNIQGDNQNSIFIGTHSSGVLRLKDDQVIERYNTANGLVSNNINNIRLSGENLVVSTDKGINIINFVSGEIKTINEGNGAIPKDILVCEIFDDYYWVGSNLGLSIIKANQIGKIKNGKPTLSLKNMYANGLKIEYDENLNLDYTVNTILINFNNISFEGNNKSIKYRIMENDTLWVQSTDPLIRLQSLKYGKYTIEAVGLNALKEEGNKVSLAFTINPPWWQTLWARIIGVFVVIGAFQIIIRLRAKRIRKEEATKRDYLTQINKIKDQALQLQMNPHFIFNSLNAIQGFIGTDEEEKAMNFLARFARLIRLIFEHSKGNKISMEEELEFIHIYLDLEKLRFKDKVNIEVTIDPEIELNKDMIYVPPLLIQPIVENSFKHGLFHKKGQGELSIDYTIEGDLLKVTIQDNGIGREAAKKVSNLTSEKHISSGIKTTQERIDLLNFGRQETKNSITIVDLYNEDGSPAGTKTIFQFLIIN